MAYLSRAFAPVLVLALATGGIAQVKAPRSAVAAQATPAVKVDPTAWLYKGSDLPHDPAWVFGTLPNGLRYAVRKNGVPPGQVSIRVRIDELKGQALAAFVQANGAAIEAGLQQTRQR